VSKGIVLSSKPKRWAKLRRDHTAGGRTIEHLCTLDMVEAALDSLVGTVQQLDGDELKARAAGLASITAMHMARCRSLVDSTPFDQWSTKSLRRYVRSVELMKQRIRAAWPGRDINAVEFLAAVTTMVAAVDDQLPMVLTDMVDAWGKLHAAMHDLYSMFDPELEANAEIERGYQIGSTMLSGVTQC
jgi:hypothetical protein